MAAMEYKYDSKKGRGLKFKQMKFPTSQQAVYNTERIPIMIKQGHLHSTDIKSPYGI
jgi:hypothetical protein